MLPSRKIIPLDLNEGIDIIPGLAGGGLELRDSEVCGSYVQAGFLLSSDPSLLQVVDNKAHPADAVENGFQLEDGLLRVCLLIFLAPKSTSLESHCFPPLAQTSGSVQSYAGNLPSNVLDPEALSSVAAALSLSLQASQSTASEAEVEVSPCVHIV